MPEANVLPSFMVVATFKPDTDMADVMAVVAQEQQRVGELKAEGTLGALYLATAARRTVFLETFAADADGALATISTLPMAAWWDLDVYPLNTAS